MSNKTAPERNALFESEPGFYPAAGLWFYGNIRLLHGRLGYIPEASGPCDKLPIELDRIGLDTERLVLDGQILVCGVHNLAHRRAAIVPLRWGSPRILVFSGGFYHHLGPNLREEPFRAARLWRYEWDAKVDLAVSTRAPDKMPTFARHNPAVDRIIQELAQGNKKGLDSAFDSLTPAIDRW